MRKCEKVTVCWHGLLIAACFLPIGSCGKTSFTSGASSKSAAAAPDEPTDTTSSTSDPGVTKPKTTAAVTPAPTPAAKTPITIDPIKDSDFTMLAGHDMLLAQRESRFWVVSKTNTNTIVSYFVMGTKDDGTLTLLPTAGQPQKTWTLPILPNQTGIRTYVTEMGLVFTSNGGYLFWIDPASTPTGVIDASANSAYFFKLPATSTVAGYVVPDPAHRSCIVSYRRGANRYIGLGYGYGSFVEMKMASTPPYAPIFSITRALPGWGASAAANATINIPANPVDADRLWGYSCYINQDRLLYFSQWYTGEPKALDLTTMTYVNPVTAATNGSFHLTGSDATVGAANHGMTASGSYALSGDLKGNLLNGTSYYTFTHDMVSNIIFGTNLADSKLYAFPYECLTSKTDCVFNNVGFIFSYMASTNKAIGPISALKTGGFIGLTRTGSGIVNSLVLHIKPKSNTDITQGVNMTNLGTVPGDAYMYTDFTGATLYNITENTTTFAFTDQSDFDPAKAVRYVSFNWSAVAGAPTTWSHLKLEARCYSGTATDGVAFATVDAVKEAGLNTYLNVATCHDAKVDHIDIRITQLDNASTVASIGTINTGFFQ